MFNRNGYYEDVTTHPPHRINDVCIMQRAADCKKISTADLISFNHTRLYLQVKYLSEICTPDGTKIHPECWNPTSRSLSPFLWPFQPPPSTESIRIWKKVLAHLFLQPRKGRRQYENKTVKHLFGQWLPHSKSY